MTAALSPLPIPASGLSSRLANSWTQAPMPSGSSSTSTPTFVAPLRTWPMPHSETQQPFPTSWPAPLSVLPSPTAASVPVAPIPSGAPQPIFIPAPENPQVALPDFTDDDLSIAFAPIVEKAVRSAVYAKENGIDTYLEPMLRATIRRALAEYSPASRPFQAPRTLDRFVWHLQALFTSRTYEDILFEKTHRFQVEEVFLVDAASLALVSFASCNPARHSSAKRVISTVHRLAMQLRDEQEKVRETFELPDQRHAISRVGRHVILMAVVRGTANELVLADLEFSLRRIEDRFREQFQDQGSALMHALQPFLEDCLLIQAPASAT